MLAGKPGLLHCHMGAGGPPRSGAPATGGNGAPAAPGDMSAAERDPLAPLFDAVAHSDVPVRLEVIPASPGASSCLAGAESAIRSLHAGTLRMLQEYSGLRRAPHGSSKPLGCTVQITQFLPTHCERCDGTVHGAVRWLRAGGNIDMTAGHQVQVLAGVDAWTLQRGSAFLR